MNERKIITICAGCRKQIGAGNFSRTVFTDVPGDEALISHGICDECGVRLYGPDLMDRVRARTGNHGQGARRTTGNSRGILLPVILVFLSLFLVNCGGGGGSNGNGGGSGGGATAGSNEASSTPSPSPSFTLSQTLSDEAQRTTLAFSALAMITGNLEAQSFFPPGKVADYTGFQYLRDNDPDDMGHNTSFLTRIANNVIYILSDSQFDQLKTLATSQLGQIDLYGFKRFALMKAFRRCLVGDLPAGSSGLNANAVKAASRELYLIDGQISFDRAALYSSILTSMTSPQKAYFDAMKGKGGIHGPTSRTIRSGAG
jgi:hypothetical protein